MRAIILVATFCIAVILGGCSTAVGTPVPGSPGASAPSLPATMPGASPSGPGTSIAVPSLPSFNPDADLAARFPTQIAGSPVEVQTVRAADFLELYEPGSDELADFQAFLNDIGVGVDAVSIGIGQFEVDDTGEQLQAIRAAGGDSARLLAALVRLTQEDSDDPASVVVTQGTVGGKPVTILERPDEDTAWLYAAGDIVFSYEGSDATLADQVMGAIP